MKVAAPRNNRWLLDRRLILLGLAGVLTGGSGWAHGRSKLSVQVWKDPNCGCCQDWVEHLQKMALNQSYSMKETSRLVRVSGCPGSSGLVTQRWYKAMSSKVMYQPLM